MTINKYELKLEEILSKIFAMPAREYRFHIPKNGEKQRKWRFDFAYPELFLAFEVEGGTWSGGRHVNPLGYAKDCEKYNMAACQSWTVYRLVPSMINEDYIIDLLIDGGFLKLNNQ
jgi:hypothetical protein